MHAPRMGCVFISTDFLFLAASEIYIKNFVFPEEFKI